MLHFVSGASGLEKDVDDPQGVYPQSSPVQRKSSSLALEGDEESSGQTVDNAADISSGRKRRSLFVGRELIKPIVTAARRRRLVSKWRPGLSPEVPVLSSFPSSSSNTASFRTRTRRDTTLLSKPRVPIRSQYSAKVGARKRRASQKTLGPKAKPQRRLARAPIPLAVGTVSQRRRRETDQQNPADSSALFSPQDHPVIAPDRQARQADNDDDGGGDDDGNNDTGNSDDEDDDGSEDVDTDGGEIDIAVLRKKRGFESRGERGEEEDWGQTAGPAGTLSSVGRHTRQADIVKDIIDTDDELDDSEDNDEIDNGDNDDDDDFIDLSMFRKKRESGSGERNGTFRQQVKLNITKTMSISTRNKRDDNGYDALEYYNVSPDNDDDEEDATEDDELGQEKNDMNDVMSMGLARRKRGSLSEEHVQRSPSSSLPKGTRVARREPNSDDIPNEDELINIFGDLQDEEEEFRDDKLDYMAAGDTFLPLRRRRSVAQSRADQQLPRPHRSSPVIRQLLHYKQEMEAGDNGIQSNLTSRKRSSD